MSGSRVVTVCVLFVAVLAGAAPWRVSLAQECAHSGVWLPLGACADVSATCAHKGHGGRVTRQAAETRPAHDGCPCKHAPKSPPPPEAPSEDHCHCSDQPLVTGMPLVLIALDAPALVDWSLECADFVSELGVQGVAPSEPDRGRVACEEDSIVLLR